MTLTDFQRKKLLHLFHTFFDANQNGTIDKKDFDMALDKTATLRSLKAGDAKHKEVQDSLTYVWEHLKKVADRDNDGTVSKEEWLKMWDEAISAKQNPEWVQRYQSFLFEVEDVSGDGKVDEKEYTTAYTSYGVTADECKEAFKKLTKGGPDTISKNIFEQRFQEFVTSNDPAAAGNYLFGKSAFQ